MKKKSKNLEKYQDHKIYSNVNLNSKPLKNRK